ncbi:hypothetical protein [Niameybacter massiliensis]|uniref:hypothetical protein n=1 Tax=Niameybacter massiliensis TaxID=1658108 RepID=UPI0006B41685|nr:hypothetical protein [Niameybacter massiliensis]
MSDTLLKLLKDKKVADSYQFYTSCDYKLYFAETSLQALQNIVENYQTDEAERVAKVYSDAIQTGVGKYSAHTNTVDYLGVEMRVTSLMDKLTMEILGLLHNFFDTYAQWLNSALLGENALLIKGVTLSKLVQKIGTCPEYTGTFLETLKGLPSDSQYGYIADFNNILKHRYQIYVDNRFDILSATGSVSIPSFTKDSRTHIKEDALKVLKRSLDFCKQLLSDSREFIEEYYLSNDCKYVTHRIYNPNTYMVFETKEDARAFRSPKNHYYFIEVDPTSIQDEYHVMLCYDRMDNPDDKRIKCYNSGYPIIMLKDKVTQSIIGIMKPMDSEVFKLEDEHELQYRKYATVRHDYQYEMAMAICEDTNFTYYMYLSDATIVTLRGDK